MLHHFALAFDLGTLVLILMVQLIIYPSFREIHKEVFTAWHTAYCKQIGYLVLPLMTYQMLESFLLFAANASLIPAMKLCSVSVIWLLTFSIFVPLHNQLREGWDIRLIEKLIRLNWIRTFAWSMVFLCSCILSLTNPGSL